ncbi:MAG: BlaI/MecI/CopY family transcriptional regulator [Gammaproteobacteria bacterium]|nr:BlaI/MecI/CopY family transcriptional regulator [Pseudomonadales bacterium]MCP5348113.1 BlaI/MecI/CopY family transcriptional regulator [Pseudomonadales bacterium]
MEKNRPTTDRHAHNALTSTLGELELLVLEKIWASPGMDAKSLLAQLSANRRLSLSTVQSTLERLVRKQHLEREKNGHAFCYFPLQSRAELMGSMLREVIQLLHDGQANTILSSFVNVADRLDEKALDQLEALIQRKRRERREHE